jgi:hypothetical protein
VRDVRVLAEGGQLAARDVEDGAAAERFLDPRAVARREGLDGCVAAGDDHAGRFIGT